MLSYMIPVEDKPPPVLNKNHLQLDLEIEKQESKGEDDVKGLSSQHNGVSVNKVNGVMAPTTVQNFITIEQIYANESGASRKIIKTHTKMNSGPAMSTESSASSLSSKASDVTSGASQGGGATPTGIDKLKPKLVQNGATKTTSLKRVSFGSSKGSMVETLIYESPLQEEPEVVTPTTESPNPFPADGDIPQDRSDSKNSSTKVRVTFFESERPLVVHSPEPGDVVIDILNASNVMASASPTSNQQSQYLRQTSTESGWDNPFRPDGDLSREADEIVELIREGKPIVYSPGNGTLKTADERDGTITASVQSKQLSASPQKGSNGSANCGEKAGVVDVQRSVVSPANGGEAEAVVIKKKPKCKCCVIQ